MSTKNQTKAWRDEVFKTSHVKRNCIVCGIITVFEKDKAFSHCLKCRSLYNLTGNKLLKMGGQ